MTIYENAPFYKRTFFKIGYLLTSTFLFGLVSVGCLTPGSKPNPSYISQIDINKYVENDIGDITENPTALAHDSFARLYRINPRLAEEVGRLPEFQDGINLKEAQTLEVLADSFSDFTSDGAKRGLDNLLNYGYPDKRKFNSLLQAMFWYAEKHTKQISKKEEAKTKDKDNYNVGAWVQKTSRKGTLDDVLSSIKKGYQLDVERVLNSLDWFSYTGKWDDFNEVTDRLNSPRMVSMWMKKNLRYNFNLDIQNAYSTFKKKTGECEDHSIFATYCLLKAGYDSNLLVMKWTTGPSNRGHVVSVYKDPKENLFVIDNSQHQGIYGPYHSMSALKSSVAKRWGKSISKSAIFSIANYESSKNSFWQ